MVQFRPKSRELIAKVVYYGPPLGGKTTNLRSIYAGYPPDTRGELIIVPAGTDRTIFFDFLPVELGTLRGMRVRVQLYTVPGQVRYNATRQVVLRGVDGVVFVADSQKTVLANNKESWENLKDNLLLQGVNLAEMAHVMQYNKRDLKDIASIEQLDEMLNEYNAPFYEAVASEGIGVEETLQGMVKLVVRSLRERFRLDGEQALTQPIHMGVHGVGQAASPGGSAAGEITTGFALVGAADTVRIEGPVAAGAPAADAMPLSLRDPEITQVGQTPPKRDELSGFGGGLAAQWAALEARSAMPAADTGDMAWPLEGAPATPAAPSHAEAFPAAERTVEAAPAAESQGPASVSTDAFPGEFAPAPPAFAAASGPALDAAPFEFEDSAAKGPAGVVELATVERPVAEAVVTAPGRAAEEAPAAAPFGGLELEEVPAAPAPSGAATEPPFESEHAAVEPIGAGREVPLFGPAGALGAIGTSLEGSEPQPIGDEVESLAAEPEQAAAAARPDAGVAVWSAPPPAWPEPVVPAAWPSPEADAARVASSPYLRTEARPEPDAVQMPAPVAFEEADLPAVPQPADPFGMPIADRDFGFQVRETPAAADSLELEGDEFTAAPAASEIFPAGFAAVAAVPEALPGAVASAPAMGAALSDAFTSEPALGAEDPFDVPSAPLAASGGDVFAIVPAPPVQVTAAAPVEYEPETVVVPVEISAVRRIASRALAQVGEVRELELEVPVPSLWIGGRRMTLQVRLTLVPQEEDDER